MSVHESVSVRVIVTVYVSVSVSVCTTSSLRRKVLVSCVGVRNQMYAESKHVTPVGFEPTPFRTGALSQRLRPLGQSVLTVGA
jgi:hypothetical protein